MRLHQVMDSLCFVELQNLMKQPVWLFASIAVA